MLKESEQEKEWRQIEKKGEKRKNLNLVWPIIYRPGLLSFTLIKTACDLFQLICLTMKKSAEKGAHTETSIAACSHCTNSAAGYIHMRQNRRTVGYKK